MVIIRTLLLLSFIVLSSCGKSAIDEEGDTVLNNNPPDADDTLLNNPPDAYETTCNNPNTVNVLHVMSGATGDGSGSDWDNALHQLPASLLRGYTYYIANGNYPAYVFDDATNANELITIRKATSDEHGVETGWDNTFSDGEALFGQIEFETGDYVFDGCMPGGFRVVGGYQGEVINIPSSSNNIHIKYVDVDGNFTLTGGSHTDGACTGVDIRGSNVIIESSDIYNIADDGIAMIGNDQLLIKSSKIHMLHGCGTDGVCNGPCYNGHSDGIEIFNATNIKVIDSMVYDVQSSAAFYTSDLPPDAKIRNLTLINNIFYSPTGSFSAYLNHVVDAKVMNNIFWGRTQGSRFGGLAVGDVSNVEMKNNIILNINTSHLFAYGGDVFNAALNDINNNLFAMIDAGEYTQNSGDIIGDPMFVSVPESGDINQHILDGLTVDDFRLGIGSDAIDSGIDLSADFNTDIVENVRPQDGDNNGTSLWDMGPLEM